MPKGPFACRARASSAALARWVCFLSFRLANVAAHKSKLALKTMNAAGPLKSV